MLNPYCTPLLQGLRGTLQRNPVRKNEAHIGVVWASIISSKIRIQRLGYQLSSQNTADEASDTFVQMKGLGLFCFMQGFGGYVVLVIEIFVFMGQNSRCKSCKFRFQWRSW